MQKRKGINLGQEIFVREHMQEQTDPQTERHDHPDTHAGQCVLSHVKTQILAPLIPCLSSPSHQENEAHYLKR